MAELTGLEPATSAVTGQRSNQLSYNSVWKEADTRTNFPELQQNFEPAISSSLPLSRDFLRVRAPLNRSSYTVPSVRAFPIPLRWPRFNRKTETDLATDYAVQIQ